LKRRGGVGVCLPAAVGCLSRLFDYFGGKLVREGQMGNVPYDVEYAYEYHNGMHNVGKRVPHEKAYRTKHEGSRPADKRFPHELLVFSAQKAIEYQNKYRQKGQYKAYSVSNVTFHTQYPVVGTHIKNLLWQVWMGADKRPALRIFMVSRLLFHVNAFLLRNY